MFVSAIILFVIAVFILLGALGLAIRVVLRPASWEEADAEIVESSVEPFIDAKQQRLYRGMFLLRYRALNDVREALVRSAVSHSSKEAAAARVAQRPAGSRVRIHYDPHAPSQVNTSLSLGTSAFTPPIAAALFGGAIAVLAVTLWFLSRPSEW